MAKILFILLVAAVAEIRTQCQDRRSDCTRQKQWCSRSTHIRLQCPATCGVCGQCRDRRSDCRRLKNWCSRSANIRYQCPATCGVCGPTTPTNQPTAVPRTSPLVTYPPTGECRDRRSDCTRQKYWCSRSTRFRSQCPVTCGVCRPTTRTNQPTAVPHTSPLVTYPPTGGCGKPEFSQGRVIAGTTATRGAWPWQILMVYNGRGGCGGSIVSPNWIVTAAHCVSGKERQVSSFSIRVGEHNQNSREGSEKDYKVSKIVIHPGWNRRALNNDIAMMKVARPIAFNSFVKPVCLPNRDAPVGTSCTITGWGKTRHPGSMTSILQQAELPVVTNTVCANLNKKNIPIPITSAMICGGSGGATRQSGCHGDSGGPFVCNIGGRWELHGAVSHGSKTCNSKQSYTVFARVSHFSSWINSNLIN